MGFYEKLGIAPTASRDDIRTGYHRALGRLVRKLRLAREAGADTAALEAGRDELKEAFEVLSDPARRRVYDGFVSLEGGEELPPDLEAFWNRVRDSVAEPAAAAAVDLIRALTALPVGESLETPAGQTPRKVEPRPMPAPAPAVALAPDVLPTDPGAAPLPGPLSEPLGAIAITSDRGDPAAPAGPDDPVLDVARLAETYGYDGRYLQSVRQLRGISLDEVAAETKIALRYLEAIEVNDFARLPAAVFVRGYLRELAEVLELEDPDALVSGYMDRFARYRG